LASRSGIIIDPELKHHVDSTYSPLPRDEQEKLIEAMLTLTEAARDRRISLRAFLERVARTLFRFFSLDEIAIGLYDRTQKMFVYEVLFGYPSDLAAQYSRLKYEYEDMISNDRYPFIRTGKLSELDPVEGLPSDERQILNRPYAGSLARAAEDEFHEGDYIDVWMYGPQKSLLGWLEISKPRSGRLPSRTNLRWIEVIASICSFAIRQRWLQEDVARR